uniref:Secreted protein n=1 Tax=Nymphaea colorata TaxID=210225 RepID=A0A5K1BDD7_9MAGN
MLHSSFFTSPGHFFLLQLSLAEISLKEACCCSSERQECRRRGRAERDFRASSPSRFLLSSPPSSVVHPCHQLYHFTLSYLPSGPSLV